MTTKGQCSNIYYLPTPARALWVRDPVPCFVPVARGRVFACQGRLMRATSRSRSHTWSNRICRVRVCGYLFIRSGVVGWIAPTQGPAGPLPIGANLAPSPRKKPHADRSRGDSAASGAGLCGRDASRTRGTWREFATHNKKHETGAGAGAAGEFVTSHKKASEGGLSTPIKSSGGRVGAGEFVTP